MIVITAPTGQIGSTLLPHLLPGEHPLRLVTRSPAKLADDVRDRVEIVTGSHGDPAVVDDAFAGADTVFWLCAADPSAAGPVESYVGFTRPAAEAFARHGVSRVVSISALGRGTPFAGRAGLVTGSLAMDDLIASTGVALRSLVMPSFMDNVERQLAPIRDHGRFSSPIPGDHRAPTCAVRDIAATAARLLLDGSWSGQAEVPVLGPEDLSPDDQARIMTEVLGVPVRHERVADDAYRQGFVDRGMSEPMAQAMLDMAIAKRHGLDEAVTRTPQTSTPTSFARWCEEVLAPALAAG